VYFLEHLTKTLPSAIDGCESPAQGRIMLDAPLPEQCVTQPPRHGYSVRIFSPYNQHRCIQTPLVSVSLKGTLLCRHEAEWGGPSGEPDKVGMDIQTGPNCNPCVVLLFNSAIYEIFRRR
jgi:hypothetical protein